MNYLNLTNDQVITEILLRIIDKLSLHSMYFVLNDIKEGTVKVNISKEDVNILLFIRPRDQYKFSMSSPHDIKIIDKEIGMIKYSYGADITDTGIEGIDTVFLFNSELELTTEYNYQDDFILVTVIEELNNPIIINIIIGKIVPTIKLVSQGD